MISTASVQTSIIALLKAYPTLVDKVGDEIREESWMGTEYDYPCARVHVTRLTPTSLDSNCETFDVDFNVSYRDEDPSSAPIADGAKDIGDALIGKKLSGTGFVSRFAILLINTAGPIPEAERVWMARVFFTARIQL